jgi:hypothetical protein
MTVKKLERVVHDGQPTRIGDIPAAEWIAPATRSPKLTAQEQRIRDAHGKGADLSRLVSNYAAHPATIYRIIGLNPAEHAEVFSKLLAEFNNLQTRALK